MTLLIKESNDFLSAEAKKNIEKILTNSLFPFYMCSASNDRITLEYPFLSHIILKHPEDRSNNNYNSEHAGLIMGLLESFCDKNKIKINHVFRVCVNLTFNFGKEKSFAHQDHNFDHKQLIIYLNDCDKNAKTILLNEDNKISDELTPEKYKGILFKKCRHYMVYPKKGYRIIAIYTFD